MRKQAANSPLSAGAAALKQLVKAIADSPCREVPEVPEVPGDEDSHDYVCIARLIEDSIQANLVEATGLHRNGYLRALTDALAMFADGCTPSDEDGWDPIANTAAAFKGKAAAVPVNATTPRGLAVDATSKLAGMPRDLAHRVNFNLLEVVTLLNAAIAQIESDDDSDDITSRDSRTTSLVMMADDKVRGMLHAISAYV